MEIGNLDMPSKLRKRRLPTASSSSFPNDNNNVVLQLLLEKNVDSSPRNYEKCIISDLERSSCHINEQEGTMTLQKMFDKSVTTNVDRYRNNNNRSHPGRVYAPEVINPHYRHPSSFMEKHNSFNETAPLTYDAKPFEGKSRPCGEIETKTKNRERSLLKPTNGLEEIKHALTISKEVLKLLTRVWTADPNHDQNHPTSISLASTLNHELNKARSHVNKLIQEQQSNNTMMCETKEQDKIRFAVKTIARELETERKLRRQTERMNKKLGRELASTKSSLDKAIKKAESEKQATEILEQLCEKMENNIEEDRVELEELKKESERVREEMEEEREMLRVADLLREERVQMKLIEAKHEYEDKHKQLNILMRDLEELLEADDGIDQLKRTPKVLSWYQSTMNTSMEESIRSLWHEKKVNANGEVVNEKNTLEDETRGLSWFENNKGEVVNDDLINTSNEVMGRNSDCIEWEFGLGMKNESEDLNECLEERVIGFSCSSTMKEYEDEMERYKMIKDLRDRIVSGSDLSRDTLDFGTYI